MSSRKQSQKAAKHPNKSDIDTPPANHKWYGWWIFFCLVLILQREITTPNIWWELSRGRAVVGGSFTPSQDLLTLESHYDADWLGGLPFFLTWSLAGVSGLAAIPILAGILLTRQLRSLSLMSSPARAILLLPLLLFATRQQLQPIPELLDLFALILLAELLSRKAQPWSIFVLFLAWMNVAPGPIWGFLWLLCALMNSERRASASPIPTLLAAIIGGSLNPRGIFGWIDSARRMAPNVLDDISPLIGDHMLPAFIRAPLNLSETAFIAIWVGCILSFAVLFRSINPNSPNLTKLSGLYLFSIPLLGVLCSRANIPICSLWLFLIASIHPEAVTTEQQPFRKIHYGWKIAGALVASLSLWDATVSTSHSPARIGWGISQSIDHRTLNLPPPLQPGEVSTAWAPDERSVGIVTWMDAGVQMVDHPMRALLGNRIRNHLEFAHDLKSGHRARYRREDGRWGGWVRTAANWKVECLFLPVEQLRFNHSMVTSTWRPFDLDSPTIPYAQTGSDRFSPAILETLQQQGFVELGPWQPTVDIYDGLGWRLDLVQLSGGTTQAGPAIRQSQIFRAMDLPAASLRALLPLRQQALTPRLQREFIKCQSALAFQEWTTFGDASLFRKLLAEPPTNQLFPWIELDDASPGDWSEILDLYLRGDIVTAISACDANNSQQRYAIAMMWLELGDVNQCQTALAPLLSADDATIRIAANYWRNQISQFVER